MLEDINIVVAGESDGRIKSWSLKNDGWETQANIEEEVTALISVKAKNTDWWLVAGSKEGKLSLIDPDFKMR